MLKATNGTDTIYYTRGFELISRREGDATSFYLYDGGLSVRVLTDTTGAITDTLVFDAFGNETEKAGTTANTYGFQGEEQDATGLYYLRARYMDPASGTFTSMDTYAGSLSDPISLHKYLFANSNPIMYSDPSGHYTLTEQETAIAIQAILGEAISGIVYIFDWFITDPDSKNHSIGKMIIAMMLGLARSAVMGSWGGLLSGLISKAGMSVLDYLLTGIMFALFSGNLKLAAINLRESGNFKVAAICNAGGAFADFVAFCSFTSTITSPRSTGINKQNNNQDATTGKSNSKTANGRSFDSKYDIPKNEKGYTKSNLTLGRKVHNEYKSGDVDNISKFKEFVLPSKKRVDFIDFETKTVYELKPYNPRQINNGNKQLKNYIEELNRIYGPGWKGILDTY